MNDFVLSLVQTASNTTPASPPTPIDWNMVSAIGVAAGGLVTAIVAILIFWQLLVMKRATTAQAFWPVAMFLQDDRVHETRRTLLNTTERDFGKWSDAQKRDAELACNAYDIVGIMLKRTVIDHKMVTLEWRMSIIDCWTRSEPIRKVYREKRGMDYWKNFEWLYEKAKRTDGA